MTPSTRRIVETCLYVADVDRAAEWYRLVFGFPIIFGQEDRLRALQVADDQVLIGRPKPLESGERRLGRQSVGGKVLLGVSPAVRHPTSDERHDDFQAAVERAVVGGTA